MRRRLAERVAKRKGNEFFATEEASTEDGWKGRKLTEWASGLVRSEACLAAGAATKKREISIACNGSLRKEMHQEYPAHAAESDAMRFYEHKESVCDRQ